MTTQEIYKFANEITEKELNNTLNGFSSEEIKLYEDLVKLGDKKQVALFTVIAKKYNEKEASEIYNLAYES